MDASTVSLVVLFVISVVPFVPTEVTLVGMGVLAADQDTSIAPIILVAASGCLLGDYLLYATGRKTGGAALTRLRRRPSVEAGLLWLSAHIERRPLPVLVAARWLPAGGTVGSLLAGTLRWPRVLFLVASTIGVTLWSTYAVLLGYLGGAIMREPVVSFALSAGLALVLGSVAAAVLRRRAGHDLGYARRTTGRPAVHTPEQA
ncbi:hypothetical protein BAY61_29395 [Prauserella marina]|uniref:Membrane protein DedA, SNARE-associated domain n=1 Tax=Prauserella marina TaxID=530584 RepID=A0A222VWT5_9PSEU|nr:DedA family protein [Prauserella marina]ASR38436.1 hypothetical protein BAY61_29395 [Prauserella marina]PWV78326.1 membrane protein DedA with SNARE-associated domain [Prauserella marina]SDC83481.1 membrane protein DedA, SNARE-associated domain [Prauserella marina]